MSNKFNQAFTYLEVLGTPICIQGENIYYAPSIGKRKKASSFHVDGTSVNFTDSEVILYKPTIVRKGNKGECKKSMVWFNPQANIAYNDVDYLEISLCSRGNLSITGIPLVRMDIVFDIVIISKLIEAHIEVRITDNFNKLYNHITKHLSSEKIRDPFKVSDFIDKPDFKTNFKKYCSDNFTNWAEKFNLDVFRGLYDIKNFKI